MITSKFDIEKFIGENDFNLWRIKMRPLLVHQGLEEAVKGTYEMSDTLTEKEKRDILTKAHSVIVLSLGDKVLREVSKQKTAAKLWTKLESLYMKKSLANKLYRKRRLYTLAVEEGTSLDEHLDMSNKIILDLEKIDI
ncbi:Retrovirus-related Pol polyprotein from transposon TNT 1-94 [Melia azedarach]|uniref:Retrovirus-related Pol polyprotein from transposon TNT 1-94 n=1 Tax=Melia azedarach TaxID=155640 RepID=A0ACC1XCF5_MELAZ|nr:Retrovirus-related Pol polyprotein from transposon TNT 1-94 [Melia azedarach]